MSSPSIALLSVLVAGRERPTRLLIQEGSPTFVSSIGRLVGAAPQTAPPEDCEELRKALLPKGSGSDRVLGVATHRGEALVPSEWFAAFEAKGIPTVELCMGGLFQLARRGPPAATFSIVSLDAEPVFEGAQLTAVLTNDAEFARRLRLLCLGDASADGSILDAAPRGLAEDETALRAVLESAIARDETEWAAAQSAPAKTGPGRGISLAWKRIFQADSPGPAESVPPKPDPGPIPPPRGKNSWLTRLADVEQQYRQALDQAKATSESIRTQSIEQARQAQKIIDEGKARLDEAESKSAARMEQLQAALEAARRGNDEHEKALAARKEREARLTAEGRASRLALSERIAMLEASIFQAEQEGAVLRKETADLQEALETAKGQHEALSHELEQVAGERRAAIVGARESEEALRSLSRDELAAAETRLGRAQAKAAEDAARLSESHAQTLARVESRIGELERERNQVKSRLESALAERDRDIARHEASAAAAEKERLAQISRAQELENSRTEALARLARVEEQAAQLTTLGVSSALEREALATRLFQADEAHRDALRSADERTAPTQRELALEKARLIAEVAEWQTRFDRAAVASTREAERVESRHTASVDGLHEESAHLRAQAESTAKDHSRELSSVGERTSLLQAEKLVLSAERDAALARMSQSEERSREELRLAEERSTAVQREKTEETSRLNAAVTEWQERFDTAARTAVRAGQHLENYHAERVARLEDELAELRRQNEATVLGHTQSEESLTRRLSELDEGMAAVSTERDEARLLLGQLERERIEEVSGLKASLAEGENRFAAFKLAAEAEARRIEAEHRATTARLQNESAEFRRQADALAAEQTGKELDLEKRLSVLETEKAGLSKDRDALAARLKQAEQVHGHAQKLSDRRVAALEREKDRETARLSKATTAGQTRFDAAAKAALLKSQQVATRYTGVVARLQEKLSQLKKQRDATASERAREAKSFATRLSSLEREKADLLGERAETETRFLKTEERHHETLRLVEERAAALKSEELDVAARLTASVADWQSRFDAAAMAATSESQQAGARHEGLVARLEAQHKALVARLEDEVSQLRRQGEAEAKGQESEVSILQDRISSHEREKVEAQAESREAESRFQKQEENHRETLRLLEQRGADLQIERVEETARLKSMLTELQSRLDVAARIQSNDAEVAAERVSLLEGEKAAASDECYDLKSKLRLQEESHREALNGAEQRAAASQLLGIEGAARLNTIVAEWQSRLDLAREASASESQRLEMSHAALVSRLQEEAAELLRQKGAATEARDRETAASAERRSRLEGERASLLGERREAQIQLNQQEASHLEALRLAEQRTSALQIEKVEEATQFKAALAEWQSRFDLAAKAGAQESQRLEASHAALVARLRTELQQLKTQGSTAAESQGKATAEFAKRLLGLESDKTRMVRERDEIEGRLRKVEQDHAEALRAAEERTAALQREKAFEASKVKTAMVDWQARLEAAQSAAARESQALETRHREQAKGLQEELTQIRGKAEAAASTHDREAAALAERLSVFKRDMAALIGDRDRLAARLTQGEDDHREALRSVEARLAEAAARVGSAEARLAATEERAKAIADGAGQLGESLRIALEGRTLESAAHAQAVDAWAAQRATLEARVVELDSVASELSTSRSPLLGAGETSPQVADITPAPEFDQTLPDGGMGLINPELARVETGVSADGGDQPPEPSGPVWDYERIFMDRKDKVGKAPGWLQGVARRIRRE